MVTFSYHLLYMLLPMMIYLFPAAVSYRYLPEKFVMPYIYYGPKTAGVTDIIHFPHHALIVYGSKYCSGTLIYSRVVVTAASCFKKNKGEAVIVKVGANSITGSGQIIPVLEYKIHEYFEYLGALDNDIALLILKNNVVFSNTVIKALFVEPEVALHVGVPLVITGWGDTNMPAKYLNLLIKAEANVSNKSECNVMYRNLVKPSNFCVKYISEQILNDNGGGAMYDNMLVGILSQGITIGDNINIAVLTNVSYFHRWIALNTKRFLTKYCAGNEDLYDEIEMDET